MRADRQEVERLVNDEANVDEVDEVLVETPLTAAIAAGCVRIVQLLLDAGADVSLTPAGGWTPLTTAVAWQNAALVDLLVDQGADPSGLLRDPYALPTALHWASGVDGASDLLAILVDDASDLDVRAIRRVPRGDDVGVGSPVEFAVDVPNPSAVSILLKAGATATNLALYRAISGGEELLLTMLLEARPAPAVGPELLAVLSDRAVASGNDHLLTTLEEFSS